MKRKTTNKAEALPEESVGPAAPPDNVVPLNAELKRPAAVIRVTGQTRMGFIEAVPGGKPKPKVEPETADSLATIKKDSQRFFEEKDAGKSSFMKQVLAEAREKKAQDIHEQIRASATRRSAPPKPADKPQSAQKLAKRQQSLSFEPALPPVQANPPKPAEPQTQANPEVDLENEPLEVVPRSRLPIRDEILAMELPLFALSKVPEVWLKPRTYPRGNRGGTVTVSSSCHGAATIHDYDLLIYCASYINDMLLRNQTPSRTLTIEAADFLRKTGRGDGRKDYEGIIGLLDRLSGTRIKTDIPTRGVRQIEAFGIIEGYKIVFQKERVGTRVNPKTRQEEPWVFTRVLKFTVTLSQWCYNSARYARDILSVDPAYFALDSGIERRLYQIARRHCGTDKALWKIGIERLAKKTGTSRELRKFREDIRHAIRDDRLPGYHIALDSQAQPNGRCQ